MSVSPLTLGNRVLSHCLSYLNLTVQDNLVRQVGCRRVWDHHQSELEPCRDIEVIYRAGTPYNIFISITPGPLTPGDSVQSVGLPGPRGGHLSHWLSPALPLHPVLPPRRAPGHLLLQRLPGVPSAGQGHRHQEDGGPQVSTGVSSGGIRGSPGDVPGVLLPDDLGLAGGGAVQCSPNQEDYQQVLARNS